MVTQNRVLTLLRGINKMNIYIENGFESREDYLESLAEDYGYEETYAVAELLGPGEDFDGLISSLEELSFLV